MNTVFPIDYAEIRKLIAREVERVTGRTCILEEQPTQKNDRPPKPYFSFKILAKGVKSGDDSTNYISDTKFNRGGNRKMVISFQCYGKDQEEAYSYMALLQSSLDLQTVRENFRRQNIAIWLIGDIADFSQLMNTGYEGRAGMDVDYGISSNLTEDLGAIETVEISGQIEAGQSTIDQDTTVET